MAMETVPSCYECDRPSVVYVHYAGTGHWSFLCPAHRAANDEHVDRDCGLDSPEARKVIVAILAMNPGRMVPAGPAEDRP